MKKVAVRPLVPLTSLQQRERCRDVETRMRGIEESVERNEEIGEEDSILLQHVAIENLELRTRLAELEGVKQKAIGITVRLREKLAELAEEELDRKGKRAEALRLNEKNGGQGARRREGKWEGEEGDCQKAPSWIPEFVQTRLPSLGSSNLSRAMKELRSAGIAKFSPWWSREEGRNGDETLARDAGEGEGGRLEDIVSSLQHLLGHDAGCSPWDWNLMRRGEGSAAAVDEDHFLSAMAQLRLLLSSKTFTQDLLNLSVDSLCMMEEAMKESASPSPPSSRSSSSSMTPSCSCLPGREESISQLLVDLLAIKGVRGGETLTFHVLRALLLLVTVKRGMQTFLGDLGAVQRSLDVLRMRRRKDGLHSREQEAMELSCKLLCILCEQNELNKKRFLSYGGIALLIERLRDGDIWSHESALEALTTCFSSDDKTCKNAQDAVREANGIAISIRLLRLGNSAMKTLVICFIKMSCQDHKLNQLAFGESGGIALVLEVVKTSPASLQEACINVLRLVCKSSHDNWKRLVSCRGVDLLCRVMYTGTHAVQKEVIDLFLSGSEEEKLLLEELQGNGGKLAIEAARSSLLSRTADAWKLDKLALLLSDASHPVL